MMGLGNRVERDVRAVATWNLPRPENLTWLPVFAVSMYCTYTFILNTSTGVHWREFD